VRGRALVDEIVPDGACKMLAAALQAEVAVYIERFSDQDLEEIYALVHTLQPNALVATNHHRQPLPNEDFQIFESAFPSAMNSWRQRSTEPKSRLNALAIASGTARPSPPRLAK